MALLKLLLTVASLALASGLDVSLQSFTCDDSLPIYATVIGMFCGASKQCTFGDAATLYGTLIYNGTAYAGLTNDLVYATADLNFLTLNYHLFDNFPLDVCSQTYIQANSSNTNKCPGDGTYHFKIQYTLPSTDNTKSWFASGWKGSGEITFYPQASNTGGTKVAYCKLFLSTAVSAAQSGSFRAPSAAVTSLLVVLLAALVAMLSLYVACRRRKSNVDKEDLVSFHRMNDDLSSKKQNSLA